MLSNIRRAYATLLAVAGLVFGFAAHVPAAAQTYTVINTFEGVNGAEPMDGLIFDKAGNLYGTTFSGGHGKGVVFELSPNTNGGWNESVLYEFGSKSDDGANPYDAVIFDANGNLYGTTSKGGTRNRGTVFELTPTKSGPWTETILHSFGSITSDGENPIAGLAIDASGNLYGTTLGGGTVSACKLSGNPYPCGTVYELSPVTGGNWTYSIIHDFSDVGDGYFPIGRRDAWTERLSLRRSCLRRNLSARFAV